VRNRNKTRESLPAQGEKQRTPTLGKKKVERANPESVSRGPRTLTKPQRLFQLDLQTSQVRTQLFNPLIRNYRPSNQ
jgi:hypothetical protein